MYTSQSTNQTEDLQIIEEISSCLERDGMGQDHEDGEQRELLGELQDLFNSQNVGIRTTKGKRKPRQKAQFFDTDDTICQEESSKQGCWENRLRYFYQLISKLIIIDQQIVYLKNLTIRLGERKKDQQSELQEKLGAFSVWEYLPTISPFPSQQQILRSGKKLPRSLEESKSVFSSITTQFSQKQAQLIFKDIDVQQKGRIDIYDVISRLESETGRVHEMKDVINLFRRFTSGDQLTMKEFIAVFENWSRM